MAFRFWVLIACLYASACQERDPEDKGRLVVHLQSSFDHTPVQISLDGQVIFDSLATTEPLSGFAESVDLETSFGVHTLELVIDGKHKHTQEVVLGRVLYVGVMRFQHGKIVVRMNEHRFYYY